MCRKETWISFALRISYWLTADINVGLYIVYTLHRALDLYAPESWARIWERRRLVQDFLDAKGVIVMLLRLVQFEDFLWKQTINLTNLNSHFSVGPSADETLDV